ncbi:acyl-CoA dehydratase activase-related protein [Haloplasma contractile]|uniref:CoA enzyme activase uncharacterized domain protein n=1 Tax=Haloplasma contractile SSD-17B TaxID=1033810 RepID=F7Q1L7_9MOLU|nr:acyl-CoA dehydratase activase-related protein [Haloplasma contractile]ERJ12947.1 CoA enzyme activase uncharacterized domain protein [Haloplasma contractile SSD-17B]
MNITFAHMGNTYIPVKTIFEELNINVVCPPKCSKRTLELGTKHSPEFICVPFKVNMGNYIESIEQGADTIFMLSGCGPCRFGTYHAMQRDILNDLGYDVEMITTDRFSSFDSLKDLFNVLKKASDGNNSLKIINTIRRGLKLLSEIDDLHALVNKKRAREIKKGTVNRLYNQFDREVNRVKGFKAVSDIVKKYRTKLNNVEVDLSRDILRIGIVGEIYTIVEPFINLELEKKLGNMGIEVSNSITTSEFVKEQMDFLPFVKSDRKKVQKKASRYLDTVIGGHTIHTIGKTIEYSEAGYDGIIHLLPFTCMPEIVSQTILPKIEKDYDIPILTLILDEMTGEAGYQTRVEAFTDLLQERKRQFKSFSS